MKLRQKQAAGLAKLMVASSFCLLIAISLFLFIATGPHSSQAQHAKREVNYGILIPHRRNNELISAGRSMQGSFYIPNRFRSGVGARSLAMSTGRSMRSDPFARRANFHRSASNPARSAGRSMGAISPRQHTNFRFKRGVGVRGRLDSSARSGMDPLSSIGNMIGVTPTSTSDSNLQSVAQRTAGTVANTCSCPKGADPQQQQPQEQQHTEQNSPDVLTGSDGKSSSRSENLSPEVQASGSPAELSLPTGGSTNGRAGGQADPGSVQNILPKVGGNVMQAGKQGGESVASALSDPLGGAGSITGSSSPEQEEQDKDEPSEERMASNSRNRNEGEDPIESVAGRAAEADPISGAGSAVTEMANKGQDKVEPVAGFKVNNLADKAEPAKQEPAKEETGKEDPVKEEPAEQETAARSKEASPIELAKEKVLGSSKGKGEQKEDPIGSKIGVFANVKDNVFDVKKNNIENKIEIGDKHGIKEKEVEKVVPLEPKKVHPTTTTTAYPTTQTPEPYESQKEAYAQTEKPVVEEKAKAGHEPGLHHEVPAKAYQAAAAYGPTGEKNQTYQQAAPYKPVLSHLSPPLYESPTVEKLAPRCQSKLHDLTGVINEILAAIERLGQRILVDEHIDYPRRDSLSRKLAIIRAAGEESRMAASVGQLRRLNESARTAGVELMRLANSKEGNEFDPSLRPLALKTRKHYVSYRKACKSSTTSQEAKSQM